MGELPEHCVPCRSGEPALAPDDVRRALAADASEWTLDETTAPPRLRRAFVLADFRAALKWVNRVGMLAEEEGHHPDFHLTGWKHVELELYTHAIGGLHANDLVLARAIDRLWSARRP